MAHGPRKWTEATVEKYLKEGRGKGEGSDYKPWLRVGEISSLGRSHRLLGLKTGREHHLFSDVERSLFLLLEWSTDVVDVREQYPLDRDLTMEIAAAHSIRHPYYPGTKTPTVMTTDFLVTKIHNGEPNLVAFNAKREEEAEDPRSIEKLEIQRLYWDGLDFPHHVVFHSQIPMVKVRNIEWIRGAHIKRGELEPYSGFYEEHAKRMSDELANGRRNGSLSDYCGNFDIRCGIEAGTGLRVARLLMQSRVLMPDLSQPNLPACPLSAFQVSAHPGQLRVVGAQ